MRGVCVAVLAVGVLGLVGCGNSPKLVSVSGRVTDGGRAVAGASVSYQPIAVSKDDIYPGPASFGITDADGRYTLKTFNKAQPGAIPGQHRVCITVRPDGEQRDYAPSPADKKVPSKLRDGSTVVEVPAEGVVEMNFDFAKQ